VSRLFLFLGVSFLAVAAVSALFGFAVVGDEPWPGARVGAPIAAGLAAAALASSLYLRRWERAVPGGRARPAGPAK
jgi:hypothetical protein